MKNNRSNKAVSEVVGTIMLLSITITLFMVICNIVLSYPTSSSTPSANIMGTIEDDYLVIEHLGGEELSLDTKILIEIDGEKISSQAKDLLDDKGRDDGVWGIGEYLVYKNADITGNQVKLIIVDVETESVLMTGQFNGRI